MIDKKEQEEYVKIGNKVMGKTVRGQLFEGEIVKILENTLIVQHGVNIEMIRKNEIFSPEDD